MRATFITSLGFWICVGLLGESALAQAPDVPMLTAVLTADRPVPFIHERFQVTLVVTAGGVRLGQDFSLQGLPDSGVLRLGAFRELPAQREQRGNILVEVRRFVCEGHALRAGDLRLEPSLRCAVITRRWSFFGPADEQGLVDIRVAPVSLSVKPLPVDGCPADFSMAVGQFAFDAEARPADVAVGDLITLSMNIRGQGFMDGIAAPQVLPGRHFKVYPPKSVAGTGEGIRTFEQTLVPQSTNAVEVPAVNFCFFDPVAGSYRTVTRGPFPIRFHASARPTFEPYRPAAGTQDVVRMHIGSVVLHRPDVSRRAAVFLISYWCVTLLALLGVLSWSRHKIRSAILVILLAVAGFVPVRSGVLRAIFRSAESTLLRDESGRLAPAYSALETFAMPNGTPVMVLETYDNWSKVESDGKRGWIPVESLKSSREAPPSGRAR